MPLYPHGSLRTFMALQREAHPVAPFGLGWEWFGQQLLRMLRAEASQSPPHTPPQRRTPPQRHPRNFPIVVPDVGPRHLSVLRTHRTHRGLFAHRQAHLVANDLVHGDIKDDQYFLGADRQVTALQPRPPHTHAL